MVSRYYRYAALTLAGAAALVVVVLAATTLTKTNHPPPKPPVRLDAQGLPIGPVSYNFVRSRPDARLFYPGSKLFQPVGSGQTSDPFAGVSSADAGGILTTPDSPDQVYAWYRTLLTGQGWGAPVELARGGSETSAQGYYRGRREAITIGIDDPTLLPGALGHPVPQGVTIYEYRYFINPYVPPGSPSPPDTAPCGVRYCYPTPSPS